MSIRQLTSMMQGLFNAVKTPEQVRDNANYQFIQRLYWRLQDHGFEDTLCARAAGAMQVNLYKDMHKDYPEEFEMIVNGFADVMLVLRTTMVDDFGEESGNAIFLKGLSQFSVRYEE